MQLGKPRRRLHVTPRPSVPAGPGRTIAPVEGRVPAPSAAEDVAGSSVTASTGPGPDRDRHLDVR